MPQTCQFAIQWFEKWSKISERKGILIRIHITGYLPLTANYQAKFNLSRPEVLKIDKYFPKKLVTEATALTKHLIYSNICMII